MPTIMIPPLKKFKFQIADPKLPISSKFKNPNSNHLKIDDLVKSQNVTPNPSHIIPKEQSD